MVEKWEVRQQPPNVNCDILYGIYQGKMLVLPFVRNRPEAELVCAAVNAMRACAESVRMDPLEFAQMLVDYPHVAQVVKPSIEAVKGFEKHIVEGEPLEGGPPIGLLNCSEEDDDEV